MFDEPVKRLCHKQPAEAPKSKDARVSPVWGRNVTAATLK